MIPFALLAIVALIAALATGSAGGTLLVLASIAMMVAVKVLPVDEKEVTHRKPLGQFVVETTTLEVADTPWNMALGVVAVMAFGVPVVVALVSIVLLVLR